MPAIDLGLWGLPDRALVILSQRNLFLKVFSFSECYWLHYPCYSGFSCPVTGAHEVLVPVKDRLMQQAEETVSGDYFVEARTYLELGFAHNEISSTTTEFPERAGPL